MADGCSACMYSMIASRSLEDLQIELQRLRNRPGRVKHFRFRPGGLVVHLEIIAECSVLVPVI